MVESSYGEQKIQIRHYSLSCQNEMQYPGWSLWIKAIDGCIMKEKREIEVRTVKSYERKKFLHHKLFCCAQYGKQMSHELVQICLFEQKVH